MHIVIVGGGFGGIKAALELDKDPSISVTLISDRDHFLYYPALYSTATGTSHLESVVSLDKVFRHTRVKVVQDTITQYDPTRRIVSGKKSYHYDRVVFALGVVTSYFGIEGLDRYSFSIKSYDEVKRFKAHLHNELAQDKHLDKHYIVAGAGPTGVELSAALASYIHEIAHAHIVKHGRISIKLVEAAPRILPRMSKKASQEAIKRLRSLGVTVLTNKRVEAQDDDSIIISGKDIPTETVVWTSGVSNHPFFAKHSTHFSIAKNGRVEVDEYLMTNSTTYVIGDNANTTYTGLAQTALHDGIYVAKDIIKDHQKRHRSSYKATQPITIIPIGKRWALFEWHGVVLTGWVAAALRRVADFVGYNDLLPFGQALGTWRAQMLKEEDCSVCKQA